MESASLVRSKQRVMDTLVVTTDGSIITKTGCKIHVPVRFTEHDLAYVGVETYVIGLFPIIIEDSFYSVMMVMAMVELDPWKKEKIKIDGQEYYEFIFKKGSTVIKSDKLVKTDVLTYKVYDEIIAKAKVPYYLDYDLLGNIFDTSVKHAGAAVGENPEVTELLISMIARSKEDRTMHYRQTIKTLTDLRTNPPVWTALKNVTFSATNTTNKLAGSYFDEGVSAALLYPSDRTERIEEILTK